MVYGRYNELVLGDYFMVYKPTNITGGPHPVGFDLQIISDGLYPHWSPVA